MKKMFIAFCALAFTGAVHAQTEDSQPARVEMTKEQKAKAKEDKAKAKAEREAQEEQAYGLAELGPDDIAKIKAVNSDIDKKSADLKNSGLSKEDMAAKRKDLSQQRKQRLKEALGAEKYNKWQAARKKVIAAD